MEHSAEATFPGFKSFQYAPAIAHELGVSRRDPSPVVKVGKAFYVWYSKSTQDPSGYAASVWYATSPDGRKWGEVGEALPKGPTGAWDEHGVFTPTVFIWDGTYYLVYTAVPEPFTNDDGGPNGTPTAIGIAQSSSPNGPWQRVGSEPILTPSSDPDRFDSHRVDDACVVRRDGQFWLYYKGRQIAKTPGQTKMGLARSDNPAGPYRKHLPGPVVGSGHEVCIWPHGVGVAAIMAPVGPEGSSLLYSADGLHFETIARIKPPMAPGPYREDRWEDGRGPGITWGICMAIDRETKWPYLVRFDADLRSKRPATR